VICSSAAISSKTVKKGSIVLRKPDGILVTHKSGCYPAFSTSTDVKMAS